MFLPVTLLWAVRRLLPSGGGATLNMQVVVLALRVRHIIY